MKPTDFFEYKMPWSDTPKQAHFVVSKYDEIEGCFYLGNRCLRIEDKDGNSIEATVQVRISLRNAIAIRGEDEVPGLAKFLKSMGIIHENRVGQAYANGTGKIVHVYILSESGKELFSSLEQDDGVKDAE